jgi:hypothetical protein
MNPGKRRSLGRRELLAAFAAGAAMGAGSAAGQTSAPHAAAALRVVDFHNHYVGPSFAVTAGAGAPAAQRAYWQEVSRNLADPGALLASIERAGIAARVINTPTAFIQDADGEVPPETVERINDGLAELIGRYPGRL